MAETTAPAANGGGRPILDRSAEDRLARICRVTLGGTEYLLRVLFIAGNERWLAYQDERSSGWLASLEAETTTEGVFKAFASQTDMQLDLLYAYDTDCGRREGVLPPREVLKEAIYEDEPERALAEVVKAANPKAAIAADRMRQQAGIQIASSVLTSMSPTPTAGRPKRSAKH